MLSKLPPFLRLSLCLFLSTGLHGGLIYSDWMTSPVESRLVNAPVIVSLRPATDVASSVLSERPQPRSNLASTTAKPRIKDAEQSVAPPITKVSVPAEAATAKKKSKEPSASVVREEPQEKTPMAEMVCMAPQEEVCGDLSESLADSPVEHASEGTAVTLAQVPRKTQRAMLPPGTAENTLLDTVSTSTYQSLIEAIPNYRSNPLPEYPYRARQKRWEGVVWLLVDVSSEGLVDALRVEQSCGHRTLDRAASRTVRHWQFSPATRAGLAVSSQVRIPVRFRLEGD